MSYILDALRKSDQLRQRSTQPITLLTQSTPGTSSKPAVPIYVLIALVLLAVGMAIGWLRPWHTPPTVPPVAGGVPPISSSQVASAPLTGAQDAPMVASTVPPVKSSTVLPAPPAGTAPSLAAPKLPAPTIIAPDPTKTPLQEAPGASEHVDAAAESKAIAMSELPANVQQELPAMTISMHGYSSLPRERIVMINDKLLKEGDSIAPGVRLEQITADGVVLGYKGMRIRRGLH
jgi:general secretion pathway protein B